MKKLKDGLYAAILTLVFCFVPLVACGGGDGDEGETSAAKGRELFVRNGCAVCHGDQGRGDGRLATTLKPPPRDFGDITAYKKGAGSAEIAQTIGKGLPGTSMPAFAHIAEADRLLIAHYIVELQKKP